MSRKLSSRRWRRLVFASPHSAQALRICATTVATTRARVSSACPVRGGNAASRHMSLAVNKATIVQLDTDARDVLVSNPEIVDAVVRTPRRIFLLGMKTGQTNAFFFDGAGHRILSLDINVEKGNRRYRFSDPRCLAGSAIHVAAVNDSVVLSGHCQQRAGIHARAGRGGAFHRRCDEGRQHAEDRGRRAGDASRSASPKWTAISPNSSASMSREAAIAAGVPIIASTGNQFGLIGKALSDASQAQFGSVCPQAFLPQTTIQKLVGTGSFTGDTGTLTTTNLPCSSPQQRSGCVAGARPDRPGSHSC